MDFTISKASTDDKAKIDEFVHDHFLPDMPLILAFGLVDAFPPRPPASPPPPAECQDFTLLALDPQGNLVGLAINRVNTTFHQDPDTPPEVKKMVEFMQWSEERAELHKLPERTIELRVLSVRKDWRQKGVAKRLAVESMQEAKSRGFQAMRVCCTSEFTARVARSLGWKEHYRLAYQDYPQASGRDVQLKPTPPHDNLYYYVTHL